jgi:protein maelstrom
MPKSMKWKPFNQVNDAGQPLSTKGRTLEEIEQEEERKRMAKELNIQELRKMVDLQNGIENLSTKKFVFVHFSTHCRTHDDIVVPAEGAILEMTLEKGVGQGWHGFLNPGKIPMGYRGECIAKARKTHNIPLDDENLFVYSDEDVLEDMNNILCQKESLQIKPVFCLAKEKSEIELVLNTLYQRGENDSMVVPKIYTLEDLVLCIQKSFKNVLPRITSTARDKVENFLRSFSSNAAAEYRFENAYFDVPACPFHEECYKPQHCSQSIVRNRAYVLIDLLCDVLQIKMSPGTHLAERQFFESIDLLVQEREDSYRDVARTSAEVIPDTNIFGTKAGRCGPQNGVTIDLPTKMPESYFSDKQKELNHSVYYEDPSGVNEDAFSIPSGTGAKVGQNALKDTSFNSSVLNIDNTFGGENEDDTLSTLNMSLANTSIAQSSEFGDDLLYKRRM